jgi:hypothetical protein
MLHISVVATNYALERRTMKNFTLRMLVVSLLCFAVFSVSANASYGEVWTVECEVVEVYEGDETSRVFEQNRELVAYRVSIRPTGEKVVEFYRGKDLNENNDDGKLSSTFIGLRVRIKKVAPYDRTGSMRKPKKHHEIDIIMNYETVQANDKIEKGMLLHLTYEYGNALGQKRVVHSDNWLLKRIVASSRENAFTPHGAAK